MKLDNLNAEDLPLWMRQARQGTDWGIFFVLLLSLAVGWAFIIQPDMPLTYDGVAYLFRAADYADALREGRLYPRWSPHVLYGYGAPVPHYYPPAAPYITALIEVLFTNDTTSAVRLIYLGAFCLAGSATYSFVSRHSRSTTALFAALLYLLSPFVGLSIPQILGDLPLMMTVALIPAFLWACGRLMTINGALDNFFVAIFFALLILTDWRGLIAAGIIITIYLAWQVLQLGYAPLRQILYSLLLGLLLSSFYWLPALAELSFVTWQEAFIPSNTFKIDFSTLLSFIPYLDPTIILPPPALGLGSSLILFLIVCLLWGIWRTHFAPFHRLFLVIGTLLTLIMLLLPKAIWILGPTTFCLAIGASGIISVLKYHMSERANRLLMTCGLIIILISALPLWITTPRANEWSDFTPQAQIEFELRELGWAVLPRGALLPTTIPLPTSPNRFLLSGYRSNQINRFALNQTNARLRGIFNANSHDFSFQLQILEAGTIDILNAHFAGWRAFINDMPLVVQTHPINGLLQIHIPNPNIRLPTITIQLGPTPIRTYSWIISAIASALILLRIWRFLDHKKIPDSVINTLDRSEVRLFSFVITLFGIAFLILNFTSLNNSFRPSPRYQLANAKSMTSVTDSGLQPLAYRLNAEEIRAGDTLQVTVYWQTLLALRHNYWIRFYLEDTSNGDIWFLTEPELLGDFPTIRWPRNRYISHTTTMTTSINAVSGEYRIALQVFSCDKGCTNQTFLTFFDATGANLGNTLYLPDIIYIRR